MPKGYWAASGKFLRGIEKLLEMPKFPPPVDRRAGRNYPAAIGKSVAIYIPFFLKGRVSDHID
jgi:hypothetical protein